MAFTTRNNGTLITADWWNSIQRILTGVDADQPIKLNNSLTMVLQTYPNAPTLALHAGTGMGTGLYAYQVTFLNSDGAETALGIPATITTTTGNNQVQLTAIPTGPAGTTARNLYRSRVGGGTGTQNVFLVTTLADNTTTSYLDTLADASLGATGSNYGTIGAIVFVDNAGQVDGFISCNNFGNKLVLSGRGRIEFLLGDKGASSHTYMDTYGLWIEEVTGVAALHLQQTNVTPSIIQVGSGGFGIKNSTGGKLFEMRANGNAIIAGTQYATSATSIGTASGQSFDNFDVAELFECDQPYASGTVVCPGPNNVLSKCTHDNCPCAMVISALPGFLLGASTDPNALPVAMSGRVNISTSAQVQPRDLLVSDGSGGVRVKLSSEQGHVVGFALNASVNGQVGVFLRSLVA